MIQRSANRGERPVRATLNRESPQARGLLFWAATPVDVMTRFPNVSGAGAASPLGFTPATLGGLAFDNTTATLAFALRRDNIATPRYPFTLAAWIFTRASGNTEYCWVLQDPATNINQWALGFRSTGHIFGRIQNGATVESLEPSATFVTYRWYHVCLTLASSVGADHLLYINGAKAVTGASTIDPLSGSSSFSYVLGNIFQSGSSAGLPIRGQIADVRHYARVLTPAEVYGLYDPETRWDLYWVPSTRTFFDVGGSTALVGSAGTATWNVPAGTFAAGSVALSGAAASASWAITAEALATRLTGTAPDAAWAVPTGTFAAGAVALSGSAPASVWGLAAEVPSRSLPGTAPDSVWTTPTGTFAAGSAALAGGAAEAIWNVPLGTFSGGVSKVSSDEKHVLGTKHNPSTSDGFMIGGSW